MTCRKIEALLADCRPGDLSPKKRAALEAHLGRCPECRRLLVLLEETDRALAGFPQPRMSARLRQRLYGLPRRAEDKPKKARAFGLDLVRQPLFIPAAVVLLAAVLFVTNPERDSVLKFLDRQVHVGIHKVEVLAARAGSVLDKLKAYREDALVSLKRINPLSRNGDKK